MLSISPANYDSTPQLTERFRKRFGYFMVHEALEHAVCLGVLAEALETAGKADTATVREILHRDTFTKGWSAAMTPTGVKFDPTGLNTMASPVMVQWQKGELATVWPRNLAKAKAIWKGKTV